MKQQAEVFLDGCKIFKDLMYGMEKRSTEDSHKLINIIKDCELKGDTIEHTTIEELHRTFITPIDREDIHTLAVNLDRSLDILNNIAQKIEIYKIYKIPKNVLTFADLIVDGATELIALIPALEHKKDILEITQKIHSIENKADYLFHISIADLFSDSKVDLIDVIRFKELYEHLESLVDSIDYIGKVVRGIIIKFG